MSGSDGSAAASQGIDPTKLMLLQASLPPATTPGLAFLRVVTPTPSCTAAACSVMSK